MTIFKYELPKLDRSSVSMPKDAKIMCVQIQWDHICLWAMVNPKNPPETRSFAIVGTGWEFDPEHHVYLGTVQDGPYVWHVFEVAA